MDNYLAEQYLMEAITLIGDWNFVDAKKKLESILEIEPCYGRAHFQLGWLYLFNFSDYARANYHLRLAMKLSPEFPTTYYTYAYLLNEINHPAALEKHAERALAVRGVDASIIHNELAKSFELNGNYPEAIRHYRKALQFALCNDDFETIDKSLERIKKKVKTFESNPFIYEIKDG